MPVSTDTRTYRETVVEQGKAALSEARKPLLAAVGATNLAYGQLRTQLKELPAETQVQLRKLQDEAQVQLKRLQDRAQDRAATLDPAQVSTKVRKTVEEYTAQARETYDTLAHRGDKVVRRLRRDRRVRNAFADTEELVERTQEFVTGRPATSPRTTAPRSTTTASRTTTSPRTTSAGTTSAGTTSAGTTSAGTTSAGRTPARKAPARKSTAKS